eukprot:gene4649-65382_t
MMRKKWFAVRKELEAAEERRRARLDGDTAAVAAAAPVGAAAAAVAEKRPEWRGHTEEGFECPAPLGSKPKHGFDQAATAAAAAGFE